MGMMRDMRIAKLEAEDRGACHECREGHYHFRHYCGCDVCDKCGDHKGRCKCYCGWGLHRGESEATLDADADIDTYP